MVGRHHRLNGPESEQALGDSEDREAWCAAVHGVTKGRTRLSASTTTTTRTVAGLSTQSVGSRGSSVF